MSRRPQSITIDEYIVYNAEELYNYDKSFFVGCSRIRTIIEKKKLREEDYLFAYQKKGVWVKSTPNYPRAKLFLSEAYVVSNVPKMMDVSLSSQKELYKYEEAPPLLELRDDEKFRDASGNTLEIEVRGERQHNNCYFKVKDISAGFDMPSLNKNIKDANTSFELDKDYKVFTLTVGHTMANSTVKTSLYLTYCGVLKVLFNSRCGNARNFVEWATEKLFTIQMGEETQKDALAAKLLGVHPETVADVFRANTTKTPCVYLYMIGRATDLLEGNYHPDDLLCKYGCTDDLPRRCEELHKKFYKEFGAKIELLQFSIIEARYRFDAETGISQYFKSYSVEYKNSKELIIINCRDLPHIKQYYSMIQNNYIGRYEELNQKVATLEKEILELHNQIVLKDRDIEILVARHKNELQEEKFKNEINTEKHQRELLEMKVKYLELRCGAAAAH